MRPIDADELKKDLGEVLVTLMKSHEISRIEKAGFVLGVVDEAPTLDVAPVVRCKDCKESEECRAWVGDDYCYCNVWDTVVRRNGFCDHGAKMIGDGK